MKVDDLIKFGKSIEGEIFFDYSIKNLNWFNIGGKTNILFKPHSLNELKSFLDIYSKRGKIFILGAGSNVLFKDEIFQGVVIKLGKNFSNISILDENKIVAGSSCLQKKLSEFARDGNFGGLEFMSCIPGSVGGGIRMNSGCFGREFKDCIISLQVMDYEGNVKIMKSNQINFKYRETDLPKDIIFLSATFEVQAKQKKEVEKLMIELKNRKDIAQPTRVKTGGSTFKNPKDQSNKKVWELIKSSIDEDINFGDATISGKHSNFFVNKKNANYYDMKSLIDYVQKKVKLKTGINLSLEIVIVD